MSNPSADMPSKESKDPWKIVYLLAFTQIVSWGSLYYAFAVVANDIQRDLGLSTPVVFGAFSWSLLVAGLAATPAGMLIDRAGGRAVMSIGSLLAGIGMAGIACSNSPAMYIGAWTVTGIAMAMTLYEAAFATINREFLRGARKGISVLTLFGGLASTVFWPLTLKLNTAIGWRDTLLLYAAIHVLLCLPMHAMLAAAGARKQAGAAHADASGDARQARSFTLREALREPVFWKLALAFSANLFIFSALSVHLIPLLQRFGHSAGTAVLVAALIGPMQVAGRIAEMAFASKVKPQAVGIATFAVLPLALLALLFMGTRPLAVAAFCMLYGMSNGVLTIVRGIVPQVLFGRENYGAISGALAGPSLISKAAGPLAAASLVAYDPAPEWLLGILLAVSVLSLGCFLSAVRAGAVR
ncbi:MFS transporter [Noviherbaspirillum aerium]|uniref:MFS transporter n=1 Tax=Noviherbaspirillum aerium TaxID=2588497 RepID=UPI001CEF69E1|nr:MFS transporter [Noviherbaspirillum aerium]